MIYRLFPDLRLLRKMKIKSTCSTRRSKMRNWINFTWNSAMEQAPDILPPSVLMGLVWGVFLWKGVFQGWNAHPALLIAFVTMLAAFHCFVVYVWVLEGRKLYDVACLWAKTAIVLAVAIPVTSGLAMIATNIGYLAEKSITSAAAVVVGIGLVWFFVPIVRRAIITPYPGVN
jgi:hypothetical protein